MANILVQDGDGGFVGPTHRALMWDVVCERSLATSVFCSNSPRALGLIVSFK